jgi:DNA-directed RNA polymerase subunit RPC12/RpoP
MDKGNKYQVGDVINDWTIIETGLKHNGYSVSLCKCRCNRTTMLIQDYNLKTGKSKRCSICNHEITINLLRLTYEQVKKFIEIESNSGCKLISEDYKNNGTKLKIQCKCGKIFDATFNKFKDRNQRQCPECGVKIRQKFRTKDEEKFKKEVYSLVQDKYSVLGDYINAQTKIEMRHNLCGHIYTVEPNIFLKGNRCPKCFGCPLKTLDEFKKEVYEQVCNEYEVLGEYRGNKNKILIKHNIKECGHEYYVAPSDFLNGCRCPVCVKKDSKGQKKIRKFLQKNEIIFDEQFTFNDCKNINPLPFDFVIFDSKEKSKITYLIEFDGEFHYRDVYKNGTYELQIFRDNIKNYYCLKNKILLMRIPYWKSDDIEKILEDALFNKNYNNEFFINSITKPA